MVQIEGDFFAQFFFQDCLTKCTVLMIDKASGFDCVISVVKHLHILCNMSVVVFKRIPGLFVANRLFTGAVGNTKVI